ncbi:sodium:proton antiporter [Exiguobacterium sp. SL-9]|uniref:cation:proton antiporter n=1 Tax=Exiguobacterium sp. SL-9 TaxID=2510963 RepID=UPI00103E7DF4|nr:sodium:proton antiporter [Exiguobacterium sp. SL-9]TCI22917.1 sodium:proton antiporter [Exiguobacterium sp. SL-9]
METMMIGFSLIVAIGALAQLFAWRFDLPAIIIMTVAGVLVGPIFGWIDPVTMLGDLYSPLISFAVALILFEGSLGLEFREIREYRKVIARLVTVGVLLSFIATSVLLITVGDIHWLPAMTLGALFVVTGPTVVIPLLRQANLVPHVANVLKWEGIIVDPIGALLGLFVVQFGFAFYQNDSLTTHLPFLGSCLVGILLGIVFGVVLMRSFAKGRVPEYLQTTLTLSGVLLVFSMSEWVMHEVGLLAVTAMGLTMANSKFARPEILTHLREFKENVSILLISSVFIILTASLSRTDLLAVLHVPILLSIAGILFLVRPLSILSATIGTPLVRNERLFIGWIAPRGIVAMTVTGFFAAEITELGVTDAEKMLPMTLGLVFLSVTIHGLTIKPFAKRLGLNKVKNPWS